MRQYTKRQIRLFISTLEKRHKEGTQAFLEDTIGINQRYIRLIKEGKRPGYKWGAQLERAVKTKSRTTTLKGYWETGKVIKRTKRSVKGFKKKAVEATLEGKAGLAKSYVKKYQAKELKLAELEKGGFFDVTDFIVKKYRDITTLEELDEVLDWLEKKNEKYAVFITSGRFKIYAGVRLFKKKVIKKKLIYKLSAIKVIDGVVQKQVIDLEYGYRIETQKQKQRG